VSSAARPREVGPAATCARALRAATDTAVFLEARDELAGALRDEALRVLFMNGVPAQAREDLAQAVTLTVLARIVDGGVEPGFEDGYLAVAAKNRARDWHREASGVFEKTETYDEDFFASGGPDPHAAMELAEEEADTRALAERVAIVLQRAPARYRDALVAVYLQGVPIDTLVDQELHRDAGFSDSSTDTRLVTDPVVLRRRARARVDKLLQRARDWVRARLVTGRTTPPPPSLDDDSFETLRPPRPS
jgi:DNA-directed RNA polymerase specialized sigma24 family protein